ncbi:ABC transporter permease [Mycoplasma miroungirhinis]|uniref:ABC transporter permease n=1 Tax=Mycoplasma miroungirhinis TaxID=754516 RepID=A0A6M4JE46_9MOLU|nr:ABC transporter permease [Mycoplasma miroungirhinis]QJR44299.1 ABC transporter permease [Mycoplasma miroungirhinis]
MAVQLWQLYKRHFLIFIKDRKRIFFTFMSPMIVFLCFILFARTIYKESLPSSISETIKNQYADINLMIGLLAVTTFTSAISLSAVMISDAEKKILNDLYMTPVKSSVVRFSYLLFNIFLNIIISTLMYLVSVIWMLIDKTFEVNGIKSINGAKGFYIWLFVIVGCVLNSSIFVFLLSFLKSSSAFSPISAALSAIAGFLIGAFVPLQTFPREVAEISSLIPSTQISNLIKHFALQNLGFGQTNTTQEFIILFGQNIQWWGSFIYVGCWILLNIILNFFVQSYKKK